MKKDNKLAPLKFSVKKLGSVQTGEFIQKPLTVFCGPNNSGKTWVMYALRSFYDLAKKAYVYRTKKRERLFRDIENNKKHPNSRKIELLDRAIGISIFNKQLNKNLSDYFNTSTEMFENTYFKCIYSQEKWLEWLANYPKPYVFLMPAERNGLHLFYRELSTKRTALLHHASKEHINIDELLRDVMHSRYAQPIADYIDWLNNLTEQRKKTKEFHEEAMFLQKNLVQGRYTIHRVTGDITYKPYMKSGIPVNNLGLHTASSTVKSLFGLWFYLEHQAKKGDVLMIDEPELNIHPSNQLLIARLLARLVNAGIQVVISTHSDYIVREFNNLIILGEYPSKLVEKKCLYQREEILKEEQVATYLFDNNKIKQYSYTSGQGFSISTFDDIITKQNKTSFDIYYSLQDHREGMD